MTTVSDETGTIRIASACYRSQSTSRAQGASKHQQKYIKKKTKILENIFCYKRINILITKSPGKRKKKSSVRLCMFFLGWAGLGEVRPKTDFFTHHTLFPYASGAPCAGRRRGAHIIVSAARRRFFIFTHHTLFPYASGAP